MSEKMCSAKEMEENDFLVLPGENVQLWSLPSSQCRPAELQFDAGGSKLFSRSLFSPDGVTAASPDASVCLSVYMCIHSKVSPGVYLLCVSVVSLIQKSPKMYTATH